MHRQIFVDFHRHFAMSDGGTILCRCVDGQRCRGVRSYLFEVASENFASTCIALCLRSCPIHPLMP